MPDRVNEDEVYQNAKMHSDRQNARVEQDATLKRQKEVHRGPGLPGRPERDDIQAGIQAQHGIMKPIEDGVQKSTAPRR